jgi:hypothetical protein
MKRTYIDFSDNIISDWEELDSSSTAFIKNKPFGYKYTDTKIVSVPAVAWDYNSSKNYWTAQISLGAEPLFKTVGKEYKANFNGVEKYYICK